jgi:hypothetical protein
MKSMVACVQDKLATNTSQLIFVDFLGKGEYLKVLSRLGLFSCDQ